MGYSLAIRVRSNKLRQEFLKFLQSNFHRWSIVCGKDPSKWQGSAGDPTETLSYGGSSTSIGFDYSSGMYGFERDYIYSVIRWMAIKVGDRKKQMLIDESGAGPVIHQFSEPTPYYLYDGEPMLNPILVVTEKQAVDLPKDQCQLAIDEWGVRIGPTATYHRIGSCTGLIEHGASILEETKALGEHPIEGTAEEEEWWEKRQEIYLKYLKDEMDENVKLIRQEIQRLDKLWTSKP
jgi:hypothetical protein